MDDAYLTVRPVSEAREELSRALARFRREGASAAPVIFGSHRKPEAVVIPFEAYAELMAQRRRRQAVAEARAASLLADLPVAAGAELDADEAQAGDGLTMDDELYARALARNRRRPTRE